MNNHVVVGLSGGVDSAVCAARLIKQGFSVTGVYLLNGSGDPSEAQAAADSLGIPLVVRDVRGDMEKLVITPFREFYRRGKTPNPCVLCNRTVKFAALFDEANRLGADYVATGHYARTEYGRLYQGHPARDQSYMLYRLRPCWIDRLLFPIGLTDKPEIRAEAKQLGLVAAHAKDSMDICFVPDGDYAAYLERTGLLLPPGDFTDAEGTVLGTHRGLHHYTIGQRRGLGISAASRLYVTALDAENNRVILGPEPKLLVQAVNVTEIHWLVPPETSEFSGMVRLRHSPRSYACTVRVLDKTRLCITLENKIRRPAPGQSAVLYQGDLVLGGGFVV